MTGRTGTSLQCDLRADAEPGCGCVYGCRMRRDPLVWKLALLCWRLRLDRLGNHFEDAAICGKRWLG